MKATLVILLLSAYASAQDCTREQLLQKPGAWKAGVQGSVNNVNTTDLSKEKGVNATIHKMVSTNYKPTGCQVLYTTVYGKYTNPGQIWKADPYYYSMYILRYLCDPSSADKSKYYVDISTPTTVSIAANAIFSLNTLYASDIPNDDMRGYLKLRTRPVKKDGAYFMGEEVVGDHGRPGEIKEYRWLITYNDTFPFYYLSQKEYLLIQKNRLEKNIRNSPSEKKYYEQFISNIDEYLKSSEEKLKQPAICMWNDEERFEKFVEEGTKGSFIAIKPNLSYYRKNLPLSAPQFFTVVYKISSGDPVFEENISNIQKAVDFAALRNMLGK